MDSQATRYDVPGADAADVALARLIDCVRFASLTPSLSPDDRRQAWADASAAARNLTTITDQKART